MSSPQLATCITCHAWNKDGTLLALCPNNNEVHIYKKVGTGFEKQTVLAEHDQVVTGMDWGHKTDRLVTCSQDRNAYVWARDGAAWKPTLVILRINRAATQVKWSPNEDKFAVASGSKVVSVCYFEADNDWWVSKHIKKHKSTVLTVDWHPNNVLIATGCSDFRTRIFSAFVKGVDQKGIDTAFGTKLPFGELFKEFDNGSGWIHGVSWSPSGNRLCFIAHDASISFANDVTAAPQKIVLPNLPFRQVRFIDEDNVVAAGHDCAPFRFTFKGGAWANDGPIDKGEIASGPSKTGTQAAMAMFKSQAKTGTDSVDAKLATKHQNSISCICLKGGKAFSTTGVDGCVYEWSL